MHDLSREERVVRVVLATPVADSIGNVLRDIVGVNVIGCLDGYDYAVDQNGGSSSGVDGLQT